mmetsp:Transcript_10473/g.22584  ORF Transcript_10473/g.22584 Transcript_10473/m.22584 type:complete len:470 (-) Transcript_10473:250-1659(-)
MEASRRRSRTRSSWRSRGRRRWVGESVGSFSLSSSDVKEEEEEEEEKEETKEVQDDVMEDATMAKEDDEEAPAAIDGASDAVADGTSGEVTSEKALNTERSEADGNPERVDGDVAMEEKNDNGVEETKAVESTDDQQQIDDAAVPPREEEKEGIPEEEAEILPVDNKEGEDDDDDDDDDDEFRWMTDRERYERMNYGFPPPPPPPPPHSFDGPPPHPGEFMPFGMDGRPMKSAAAYPSDLFDEEEEMESDDGKTSNNANVNETLENSSASSKSTRQQSQSEQTQNQQQQERQQQRNRKGPSVYTQEEQDLIASLSGQTPHSPNSFSPDYTDLFGEQRFPIGFREEGYLGDCTLQEISMDFSVPICYLADVIASWGSPLPIDPHSRLGDLVTGEQAFAILEAIHTLDIAELHSRYSEDCLLDLVDYYDLDLKEAFEFCMARGWSLPFGVRTFLRVEQEEELLDVLGAEGY